jgi:hypothetical protein
LVGKHVEYFTIPWKRVVGHAVRTHGTFLDFDTEVCIWTEKEFFAGLPGGENGEIDPPGPPEPEVWYL